MARAAAADRGLRPALLEAAARLIATEGPSALTLRRVAAEVGTSTMAIYTAFGGMPELRRALRHEGFARLTELAAHIRATNDPVADLWTYGRVYYETAISDPNIYRVTFMEQRLDSTDAEIGAEVLQPLVRAIERCIAAGRFDPGDPHELATEFWAVGHGAVALQLANLLSGDDARRVLEGTVLKLFRSYGDDPELAHHSLQQMRKRATPTWAAHR